MQRIDELHGGTRKNSRSRKEEEKVEIAEQAKQASSAIELEKMKLEVAETKHFHKHS